MNTTDFELTVGETARELPIVLNVDGAALPEEPTEAVIQIEVDGSVVARNLTYSNGAWRYRPKTDDYDEITAGVHKCKVWGTFSDGTVAPFPTKGYIWLKVKSALVESE